MRHTAGPASTRTLGVTTGHIATVLTTALPCTSTINATPLHGDVLVTEILVAAGGAIGSVARFKLGQWVTGLGLGWEFPIGTFLVNVFGCAVIGALAGLSEQTNAFPPDARAFVFVGLLGGFTTFSAFGLETVELIRRGAWLVAASYVLLSVAIGLGALWLSLSNAEYFVK